MTSGLVIPKAGAGLPRCPDGCGWGEVSDTGPRRFRLWLQNPRPAPPPGVLWFSKDVWSKSLVPSKCQ